MAGWQIGPSMYSDKQISAKMLLAAYQMCRALVWNRRWKSVHVPSVLRRDHRCSNFCWTKWCKYPGWSRVSRSDVENTAPREETGGSPSFPPPYCTLSPGCDQDYGWILQPHTGFHQSCNGEKKKKKESEKFKYVSVIPISFLELNWCNGSSAPRSHLQSGRNIALRDHSTAGPEQAAAGLRPICIEAHTYQLGPPARSQLEDDMRGLVFIPGPCRHSCLLVYCTGGTGRHLKPAMKTTRQVKQAKLPVRGCNGTDRRGHQQRSSSVQQDELSQTPSWPAHLDLSRRAL